MDRALAAHLLEELVGRPVEPVLALGDEHVVEVARRCGGFWSSVGTVARDGTGWLASFKSRDPLDADRLARGSRLRSLASPYEASTSCLPPVQPKTQETRRIAKITSQAETISCWPIE